MPTALAQRAQPPNLALGASFTLGACTATALVLSVLAWRRRVATGELKASIPELSATYQAEPLTEYGLAKPGQQAGREQGVTKSSKAVAGEIAAAAEEERAAKIAAQARRGAYDEELVLEQLARNRVFLGDAGLAKVRDSFVIVVGLGGVGSHCVAALARSGVGRIRVVDFDQVTLSSLNRHALATLADVGAPKVSCVKKRLEQIVPWVRVDGRVALLNGETQEGLLGDKKADWVVDAIDNVETKVELLHYCASRGIRVVSAMGAGCKSDPTRVHVGDLAETITCVFSTEKPAEGKAVLQPIDEAEVARGNVGNLAVLGGFRTRILPVLGTMPAVFGYAAANHSLMERLVRRDSAAASNGNGAGGGEPVVGLRVPVSRDDVAYLVEEVFRGKSVVSGLPTRLALVPWLRPPAGFAAHVRVLGERQKQKHIVLKTTDLVLMTKEEAQNHEKEILTPDRGNIKQPSDYYDQTVLDLVKQRLDEERVYDKYR
ncbi:hypothetical protein DV735_g4378, partial [Chaetothyriales sp. CBS 134920]